MLRIIKKDEIPYLEADAWQRELSEKRQRDEIPDTLILLEHPRTITLGRRECSKDLKVSEEHLRSIGIPVIKTDRGGGATYHGPGQVVGYFIFKLGQKPIPVFVREIEELLIRFLKQFDLLAERDPQYPGVWVKSKQLTSPKGALRGRLHPALPVEGATQAPKKIAALGLHLERGVTRHGFALNVDPRLDDFNLITPCGIQDREVTSIRRELGSVPNRSEVQERLTSLARDFFPNRPG